MKKKNGIIALVLFLVYLALLAWIILFKLQFSMKDLDTVRSVNFIPFYYDREIGKHFHLKEVHENILIFVPMGVYLQMLLPKSVFRTKLIVIAAISFLLETAQYVLAIGQSDITDLLTNTVGGLLGLAIYSMATQLLGNRNKANKLFIVIVAAASVVVIGLLVFILLANR